MFTKTDTLKVKGIAICMLLFHHLFRTVERLEAYQIQVRWLPPELVANLATGARLCVWLFAFVSAYGLALKYGTSEHRPSYGRFVLERWFALMKSFWPIYVVVFVLSFFLFQNPVEVYGGNPLYAVLDFLGIADFFETPMLSSVWWYMCFAQFLVLVVPGIWILMEKTGVVSILLVYVFVRFYGQGFTSLFGGAYINYIYAIMMGVGCVKYRVFERTRNFSLIGGVLEAIALLALTAGCVYLRVRFSADDVWGITPVLFGVASLCVCMFVKKYICVSALEKPLAFLGRHSGNIFMVHALLFMYYPRLVYGTHNVILSFLTLLAVSLAISIVIEQLKKWTRYDKLLSSIFQRITEKIQES